MTAPQAGSPVAAAPAKIAVRDLNVYYGSHHALRGVNLEVPAGKVLALIGPSGCGKSTFLRCLNRMHDRSPGTRITGQVLLDGRDIYAPGTDVVELRRRVGMVFQRPNPVPGSIYDNVALGPRLHGLARGRDLDRLVGDVLAAAGLWQEVRGRLHEPATALSGGQQQRLCIARCLAVQPEVLLMDEPTSALDPTATAKIEDLIRELRGRYTIVLVTHNLQQAARVSDLTAFFLHGELVEVGPTGQIFTNPRDQRTEDYLTGKFG